jgi:hypothetical protein
VVWLLSWRGSKHLFHFRKCHRLALNIYSFFCAWNDSHLLISVLSFAAVAEFSVAPTLPIPYLIDLI